MVKVVKAKSANSQGMRAHARKRAVYFLRRFIHERNKHACALFISLQCALRAKNIHIATSGWQNKDHTKKKVHFSSIFYLFRAFASHIL